MSTTVNRAWTGFTLACFALVVDLPQPARAQSLEAAVRACAAETDVLRRLGCYDRAAAELVGAQAPAPAPTPARAPTPSAAATGTARQAASAEAEFGTHNGPLDQRKHVERLGEITAIVSRIEIRRSDGVLIVSLDNDQVWMQNQPLEYFPLKVGDTVRIHAAALGSYMMLTPAKRTCRVTRIH
jgi:hypothetical protein